MSILLGIKFGDTAVLATDSRIMEYGKTGVLSDTQRKIFEVSPGIFYAWTGFQDLALAQVAVATNLARTCATNLNDLADKLDLASLSLVSQKIDKLESRRHLLGELYGQQLSGAVIFCGYMLAGVSEGQPGFLFRGYRIIDGEVVCDKVKVFEPMGPSEWCVSTSLASAGSAVRQTTP